MCNVSESKVNAVRGISFNDFLWYSLNLKFKWQIGLGTTFMSAALKPILYQIRSYTSYSCHITHHRPRKSLKNNLYHNNEYYSVFLSSKRRKQIKLTKKINKSGANYEIVIGEGSQITLQFRCKMSPTDGPTDGRMAWRFYKH